MKRKLLPKKDPRFPGGLGADYLPVWQFQQTGPDVVAKSLRSSFGFVGTLLWMPWQVVQPRKYRVLTSPLTLVMTSTVVELQDLRRNDVAAVVGE